MYNKKYNLLFIHIPKNAGTSIRQYMNSFSSTDEIDFFYTNIINKSELLKYTIKYAHVPYEYYKDIVEKDKLNVAIKFVIIRHPMSKLKSLFFFLHKWGFMNCPIEKFLPLLYKSIKTIEERGYAYDFNDLIRQGKEVKYHKNLYTPDTLMDTFAVIKQTDFFNIKDDVNILRFENLQNDFNNFTLKHSLPNVKLERANPSNSSSMTNVMFFKKLTAKHPKNMVNYVLDYYKMDYQLLNYKFPI